MNTKGLGKHQKYVLGKLKEGYWIRVNIDYSRNKEHHSLTNGSDELWVCKTVAGAFEKRKIVKCRQVYSTTQPDTDTYEYRYLAAPQPQQPDNQPITN